MMVMYGYGKPKRLTSLGSSLRASVLRWSIEIASRRGGGSIQRSAESRGTFIPFFIFILDGVVTWLRNRTRHLPKSVHSTSKLKQTMLEAQRVKEERRRKHTRAGESKPNPERKKVVIAEQT